MASPTFDHDEVRDAAVWSELAYQGAEYIDACWRKGREDRTGDPPVLMRHVVLVQSAETKPGCFSAGDCEGFVARSPARNMAVVAVRGTSSFADAVDDCNLRMVPFFSDGPPDGPRVHAGFFCQARAVGAAVHLLLLGWLGEVRFVGHSLGGAVSALLALDRAADREGEAGSPVSYIGFGVPRAGGPSWKRRFEALVTRALCIKNGRDPISSIPYGTRTLPYVAVGEHAHIGRGDPCPDKADLCDLGDHDVTSGYVAHCFVDSPSTVGFLPYLVGFCMSRLHRASL